MKMDQKALINYAALGAGAVIAPAIVSNVLPAVTSNAILGYGVMGVTLGSVLLAGIGVAIVDQLMNK